MNASLYHSRRFVVGAIVILLVAICNYSISAPVSGLPENTYLLDFYGDTCPPCQKMRPVIAKMKDAGYPVRSINVNQHPALAKQYAVEGVPCFVMVTDSKISGRYTGITPIEKLCKMCQEGVNRATYAQRARRKQITDQHSQLAQTRENRNSGRNNVVSGSNDSNSRSSLVRSSTGYQMESAPSDPFRLGQSQRLMEMQARNNQVQNLLAEAAPVNPPVGRNMSTRPVPITIPPTVAGGMESRAPAGTDVELSSTNPSNGSSGNSSGNIAENIAMISQPIVGSVGNLSPERLLAATVRIRVRTQTCSAQGSGTLVDARSDYALILTCGHIFRDYEKENGGTIEVDLFGTNPLQNINGIYVYHDLDTDLGLIRIKIDQPIQTIPIAPVGYSVRMGQLAASAGCDNGRVPTVQSSQITGINRFQGPGNLEASGAPASGRSGGGLFTKDGWLIGVTRASIAGEHQGLYLSYIAIQYFLNQAKLEKVYQQPLNQSTRLAANPQPEMPKTMPRMSSTLQLTGMQESQTDSVMDSSTSSVDSSTDFDSPTNYAISEHYTDSLPSAPSSPVMASIFPAIGNNAQSSSPQNNHPQNDSVIMNNPTNTQTGSQAVGLGPQKNEPFVFGPPPAQWPPRWEDNQTPKVAQ